MRRPIWIMFAGALLFAQPVLAASQQDRADCTEPNADVAIAACTRVINDSKESAFTRAAAYHMRGNIYYDKKDYDRAIADYNEAIRLDLNFNEPYIGRGRVYFAKKEYDRAIADYNQAIRLDPKDALGFDNRGDAYKAKGDLDHAIADYSDAIRLDPKKATYLTDRGGAYSAKGDLDRAIADYSEAIKLEPNNAARYRSRGYAYFDKGDFAASASDHLRANDLKEDAYGMLWRYLARAHLGQDGAAELSANAARLKNKDWPYPVIDFYLGGRSHDEMRAAASKPDEKCEAAFYTGEWQLLRGDKTQAKALLRIAADTCSKDFTEYDSAIAELKRINP